MKSNLPLVTVGIPIYNEAKYIRAAIHSALSQTFVPIEIIISDNCSTDHSVEIVEELAALDNRIKLHRQHQNIGPIANFKYLLANAKTKYFMWLGAHDLLAETFIDNAVQKLEANAEVVEVYPLMGQIIHEEKVDDFSQDDFFVASDKISDRILKIINNSNTGSATHGLFRTEILQSVYLDIDLNGGDMYFFLKAAVYGRLVPSDKIGYYLKEARPDETFEQQEARYLKFGFSPNWRLIHSMYPFEVISNVTSLNLNEKLELLAKARLAMFRFRGNSWGQIIKYHLKQFKLKVSILAIFCKIKGL